LEEMQENGFISFFNYRQFLKLFFLFDLLYTTFAF